MRNRLETLSGRLMLGTALLIVVSALALLAVWALPGEMSDIAHAAETEDEHAGHSTESHDDHDEGGHDEAEAGEGHEGHGDDEAEAGEGHEGHGDDEADAHSESLSLTQAEMEELSITLVEAGPGKLDTQVKLPGEVRLNQDRLAHVVPKLSGIVKEVRTTLGDEVQAGDVMAVLESRDLAAAKAAFLTAREHVNLAQATFARERGLWEEKISAEKDYLEAKNTLAEAQIALRAAQQELEALGLPDSAIGQLTQQSGRSLTRYEILAPFEGTVIEKHVALGEFVEANADVFTLADLSTVWVDLSVYQKDLLAVREGQQVVISASGALPDAAGEIAYIGPLVGEDTRTALARVVLPNPEGLWRPGLFVTTHVAIDELSAQIRVPKTALQTIDGKTQVFIFHDGRFEPTPVEVGRADTQDAEILGGLAPGQIYVATGGFHLKAEMEKEAFAGDGHGH
ncbi:MAG: efflux RND transporter periplasmic adaptor subunit [Candidatus Hydrogenedentes bacterium]|nr:efflux RND transporter periplasmic adaptor subunit [Candidatus Hydrogenedentota bacterium]